MAKVKNAYWDEINDEIHGLMEREPEPEFEGYAEYQLREAIAEARKRLGKEYTREIIEAELS